jgi:D-alanyl-D-alanine carboxypeptidase
MSMTRADGRRQVSVALNLMRWNTMDSAGQQQPHPIDAALATLKQQALRG